MWAFMTRCRSSAGSVYHSRFLSRGYTNRYLRSDVQISGRASDSEYGERFVIARYEWGMLDHFARPLWARTTWNVWSSSTIGLWLSSSRSTSPRVPTVE